MGFFSDLISNMINGVDTLKFYKTGVCLPDNTIIPWTEIEAIEGDDLVDRGNLTFGTLDIKVIGGICFIGSVDDRSDDDPMNIGIDAGFRLWKKATSSVKRFSFPDEKTFATLTVEEQADTLKIAYSEMRKGSDLFDKLTKACPRTSLDLDRHWAYILPIAEELWIVGGQWGAVAGWPEWAKEIWGFLKRNMVSHLHDIFMAGGNDKEVAAYCRLIARLGLVEDFQYQYMRMASLAESDNRDNPSCEERVEMCLAKTGKEIGRESVTKDRRVIICTKVAGSEEYLSKKSKGVFITSAEDLEEYDSKVASTELRFVFQPGHPQNGCTYVQHPFRKNVYYEINSYHDAVRERKQNELLRILESLGAYSARVEVRHEQQDHRDTESEVNVSGSGSYGAVSGSGSFKQNVGRQSSASSAQSAAVDWSFNPPEKPCIPDDLVFYPTEEKWQQLAASVLRGGLKQAVVDLEYKSEYGITEKYLSDISAAAKSFIPSFEMNLNRSFSSNLRRLTSTQWHYEVVFENEAGERAGVTANTSSSMPIPQISTDTSKAEALFAKRAKRYAQSEGHINAEQRADLEAFAQKYGIDDFRMEELIEEAFS